MIYAMTSPKTVMFGAYSHLGTVTITGNDCNIEISKYSSSMLSVYKKEFVGGSVKVADNFTIKSFNPEVVLDTIVKRYNLELKQNAKEGYLLGLLKQFDLRSKR